MVRHSLVGFHLLRLRGGGRKAQLESGPGRPGLLGHGLVQRDHQRGDLAPHQLRADLGLALVEPLRAVTDLPVRLPDLLHRCLLGLRHGVV
jgi:hypothetical protein